jgi:hypothetical protein
MPGQALCYDGLRLYTVRKYNGMVFTRRNTNLEQIATYTWCQDLPFNPPNPQTYYTIDGLYLRYAAARRQREREVVRAVKLLKQNQSTEL